MKRLNSEKLARNFALKEMQLLVRFLPHKCLKRLPKGIHNSYKLDKKRTNEFKKLGNWIERISFGVKKILGQYF